MYFLIVEVDMSKKEFIEYRKDGSSEVFMYNIEDECNIILECYNGLHRHFDKNILDDYLQFINPIYHSSKKFLLSDELDKLDYQYINYILEAYELKAVILANEKNYNEAIEYQTSACAFSYLVDTRSVYYLKHGLHLSNLALYYQSNKNYDEAFTLFDTAKKFYDHLEKENHKYSDAYKEISSNKVKVILNTASCYLEIFNYAEAYKLIKSAIKEYQHKAVTDPADRILLYIKANDIIAQDDNYKFFKEITINDDNILYIYNNNKEYFKGPMQASKSKFSTFCNDNTQIYILGFDKIQSVKAYCEDVIMNGLSDSDNY